MTQEEMVANAFELMAENQLLKVENLTKEMLMAVLVHRLGGTVTISKQDMKDLAFIIGNPEELIKNNHGLAMKRTKNEDGSITFELFASALPKDTKVM